MAPAKNIYFSLRNRAPYQKPIVIKVVYRIKSQWDLRKGSFKINDYEQVAWLLLYLLVCFVGLHTKKIHIFSQRALFWSRTLHRYWCRDQVDIPRCVLGHHFPLLQLKALPVSYMHRYTTNTFGCKILRKIFTWIFLTFITKFFSLNFL